MNGQKTILVIQNCTAEGPGLIGDVFREAGFAVEIVHLDAEQELPGTMHGYSALVVMGGPDSANDDTPKMQSELAFVRDAITKGIPYLGVCLGLQVGVKAMGGRVVKNHVPEIGTRNSHGKIFKAELTEEATNDALCRGLPSWFPVFHVHGETVELTPKMQLLARGNDCANQLCRIAPNAYGMQFHIEISEGTFQLWCDVMPELKNIDRDALTDDFLAHKAEMHNALHIMAGNFIEHMVQRDTVSTI